MRERRLHFVFDKTRITVISFSRSDERAEKSQCGQQSHHHITSCRHLGSIHFAQIWNRESVVLPVEGLKQTAFFRRAYLRGTTFSVWLRPPCSMHCKDVPNELGCPWSVCFPGPKSNLTAESREVLWLTLINAAAAYLKRLSSCGISICAAQNRARVGHESTEVCS